MTNPSGKAMLKAFAATFAVLIAAVYIYGETLQSHESPEDQAKARLRKHLAERGEVDRMRYVTCSRHDEPEHNPLPNVSYYVLCVIEQPKSAGAVAIEVAFGQRDQVEFWDLSR
ncbi:MULTISPECIES: hypothetical protein [unclassified Ensifer]|uniref:hypothetical protein n=1 Tax=Ensifer TaxID=106591 RepID=UPI0007621B86|nr:MULTISPECIES: hypothetical protein [unclassified Ensifer]MBD9556593.1 hypothetical protein [Ensifer sp. ENS03]